MSNIKPYPKEHSFFSTMSVLTLIVVILGFANSYGSKLITKSEPVPLIIHIHGTIFSMWLIAFVAQCLFILKRRLDWHQRLGFAGIFLAGIMLVSGFLTALAAARSGHLGIPGVEFKNPEAFLLLNLSSAFIFTFLALLGWIYRAQPHTHKRLMLMATVAGLAPPGISRLPFISGHTPAIAAFTMVFILIGPFYDWLNHGRPHKTYVYSLPLVLAILPPVVAEIASTETWRFISQWLIQS